MAAQLGAAREAHVEIRLALDLRARRGESSASFLQFNDILIGSNLHTVVRALFLDDSLETFLRNRRPRRLEHDDGRGVRKRLIRDRTHVLPALPLSHFRPLDRH